MLLKDIHNPTNYQASSQLRWGFVLIFQQLTHLYSLLLIHLGL